MIVPMKFTHLTFKKVGSFKNTCDVVLLQKKKLYLLGEWSDQDVESRIPIPEWHSFTFTKIDNDHAIVFGGVQYGPGAVNHVYCLQMKDSPTTDDPEWVCKIIRNENTLYLY